MRELYTNFVFISATPSEHLTKVWDCDFDNKPAHWYLAVSIVDDGNNMSASIHERSFKCKPTRKQIIQFKRKAIAEHEVELAQFKQDYPHFF